MSVDAVYPPLEWDDHERVRVDGVTFVTPDSTGDPPAGAMYILKTRTLIEEFDRLLRRVRPRNVMELGINRGGSVAFVRQVARPRRHVAIELAPKAEALDAYLADRDREGTVRAHFGVDQADRARLLDIVRAEFGDEPIDLVVDDASHLYDATRTSFNVLFPLLRPGGVYVIEDWSWVHLLESAVIADAERLVTADAITADRPPPAELAGRSPARLLVEHVLALAGPHGVVDAFEADRYLALVTRGDAPLDPETFDIGATYGPVGHRIVGVDPE
jgi:predicted O-methyltransferase YrrM